MKVSDNDTEDLAQQVMLKLWQLLPKFDYDDKRRFRSYIGRVTRITVYDYLRKKYREENKINRVSGDKTNNNITLPDIEKLINDEWEGFLINQALSNISSDLNQKHLIIFKRLISGEEAEGIAEDIGIKKNSVHQIYKCIKDKLRIEIKRLKTLLK